MADILCDDNRFEIIAKAKKALLEGTNIETDEAEMAVIDNILFRCWQMGWLDRYDRKTDIAEAYLRGWNDALDAVKSGKFVLKDRKTEPQTSCKTCRYGEVDEGYVRCAYYSKADRKSEPQTPYDNCKLCKFWLGYCHLEECDFTPIEDEPQTTDYCDVCNHKGCDNCVADGSNPYCVPSHYEPKDEPQSGYCNECKWYGDKQVCGRCRSRNLYAPKDEPQTEMPRCSVNGTPFDECGFCEYFNCDTCKCEADVPQTGRSE